MRRISRCQNIRYLVCVAAGLALGGTTAHAQGGIPAPAREVPARYLPVPDTVSPQMQAIIAKPPGTDWRDVPKTTEEWRETVEEAARGVMKGLPQLREVLGVTVVPTTIAGVKAFTVTPKVIPPRNRNRVLLLAPAFQPRPPPQGAPTGPPHWAGTDRCGCNRYATKKKPAITKRRDDGFL
jgi:hypothetical protein